MLWFERITVGLPVLVTWTFVTPTIRKQIIHRKEWASSRRSKHARDETLMAGFAGLFAALHRDEALETPEKHG